MANAGRSDEGTGGARQKWKRPFCGSLVLLTIFVGTGISTAGAGRAPTTTFVNESTPVQPVATDVEACELLTSEETGYFVDRRPRAEARDVGNFKACHWRARKGGPSWHSGSRGWRTPRRR
jgi:hypothetical protein